MIVLTASVTGAAEVQKRFEGGALAVRERVRAQVQVLGLVLLSNIKKDKLSGGVLNVRTGRLRRSVNEETTDAGDVIESTVGTNVVYGRFWELGFDGIEQVKAHTRTLRGVTQQVRTYSRAVHQAARPFLQPALAEMRDQVIASLSATLKEAV